MKNNLKILIVCSGNVENYNFKIHHAFVYEQIESVKKQFNIDYDTYFIKGRGITGYLRNLSKLKNKIREYNPDLVHAHYGLSGLLACLQRRVPVVITFHNSEVRTFFINLWASIAGMFSKYNIYVANHIRGKMILKSGKNYCVVPCGINFDEMKPMEKEFALEKMKLKKDNKNFLFGGRFNDTIKNYELAKAAMQILSKDYSNVNLIELKGYSREEVALLFNACDLLLLPSKDEGSPQVVKEAMASNCPVVATDVGDIREILADTKGCFITSFDADDTAEKISNALKYGERTNGREKIKRFDNKIIAEKIYSVYNEVLKRSDNINQTRVDPLKILLGNNGNVSFWDENKNIIIESIYYNEKWNISYNDSGKSRYGLFALSNVLLAKDLFNADTGLYDENIIKYFRHIKDNLKNYSKSDLSYGGLTSLILANKIYKLQDINSEEIEKIFDRTLDNVMKDYDNQDSLLLIAGKYLNDAKPDKTRLQKLKLLADRYLNSQNNTGYFETGDLRAIYHQRNMYVLWGLIFASYFYEEKAHEIKKAVAKNINWVWNNNRDKQDDAFHWHPSFYWIKNKSGRKIPVYNFKSSKYLFECHQTFFANAINFYRIRFDSTEFESQKERAMQWIFGKNRIHKDLTTINGTGLPVRLMDLNGNLFIKNQLFKGSYEVGSYALALAAENYFKSKC